jgi:hypothetical protein
MNTRLNEEENESNTIHLHDRAIEDLSFIRETMARSVPFTAVSGKGAIVEGCIALAGGWVAAWRLSPDWWIYVWLAVACLGCTTGCFASWQKGRRQDRPALTAAFRRFGMNLFPPILAGVILTEVFYELRMETLMPGLWLLLYGVGIFTGGAFSVRVVPFMGVCFVLLGVVALFPAHQEPLLLIGPFTKGDIMLLTGFGGLHLIFGAIIALRYGG